MAFLYLIGFLCIGFFALMGIVTILGGCIDLVERLVNLLMIITGPIHKPLARKIDKLANTCKQFKTKYS